MFYNAKVTKSVYGLSDYYSGNVFHQFDYTINAPAIEVTPEAKPFGFISYPYADTTYQIKNGICYGCFDNRDIFDKDKWVQGACQIYSDNTYLRANPDQVLLKVRFDNQGGQYSKELFINMKNAAIQIQTAVWGLKMNAQEFVVKKDLNSQDFLAMYTPLVSILDNISSFLSSFRQWASTHVHGESPPPNSPPPDASYFTSGYNTDKTDMKTES